MKILYHGDSPTVATGFGNVSKNLLKGLSKIHDITVIGINDRGGHKDPKEYTYKIYPAIYNDYTDLFGLKRLVNTLLGQDPEIQEKDFDVLFCQYDFTLIAEGVLGQVPLLDALKQSVKPNVKKILYTPIDNELITPKWKETLDWFDNIIVPSRYGYNILEGIYGKKEAKDKVSMVYYGVSNDFKPLPVKEKQAIRQRMKEALLATHKIEVDTQRKFIIGFVGRNQWRKDIYRTIKIFLEFKKTNPNAYLYLHTDPFDLNHDGGLIMDLLERYGQYFVKDYLIPIGMNSNAGVPRQDLNEVYNLMDVYLSSSVGEGFGLPIVEAMKAEVPVLAPNNTTMPELLEKDRGFLYKTNNTVCFGQIDYMRERELGDISAAVEWLKVIKAKIMTGEIRDKQITNAKNFADKITPEKMVQDISFIIPR